MIKQLFKTEELHVLTGSLLKSLDISPEALLQEDNTWNFWAALENAKPEAIRLFAINHSTLILQHDLLRAESIINAEDCDAKERAKRIIAALIHAQLLEHIYIKYLKTSGSALDAIQKSQVFYRAYLEKIGINVPLPESQIKDSDLFYDDSALREATQKLDFWRLIFTRGRRMLLFSMAVINSFEYYGRWLLLFDTVLSVVATYSAFLLLPRLLSNLIYVSEHLHDANNQESELSMLERYIAQMDMRGRWWEIAYDLGWTVTGILGAFVLVGALAPFAIYLLVASPSLNICLHTARLIVEQVRFNALLESYQAMLESAEFPAQKAELQNLIHALKEKNGGAIVGAAAGVGVALCMIATSTVIILLAGTSPLLAFLMAALAVIATTAGKIIKDNFPQPSSALNDDNFKALELSAVTSPPPSPHLQNSMFSSSEDGSIDAANDLELQSSTARGSAQNL